MFDDIEMANGEFAARIEKPVSDARQGGLSDEAIIAGRQEAVAALKEGYWRQRAEEARSIAEDMHSEEARRMMLAST